ncbi:MAG: ZPR1 zinc finger domain-containing protein [Candidatus Woesearchaeota archaeon]
MRKIKDSELEKENEKDYQQEILREPVEMTGQTCPVCGKNTLTLREEDNEIPYFGPVSIFSMKCSSCEFKKSDVEVIENKGPLRYTFEVSSEDDLKVRVVRSSSGMVKIPYVGNLEPGEFAEGFVTNVEGLLTKFRDVLQSIRENDEDEENREKAKNLIKKIDRTLWGREKLKIIIEDPTGNSAIISEKATVEKLKK